LDHDSELAEALDSGDDAATTGQLSAAAAAAAAAALLVAACGGGGGGGSDSKGASSAANSAASFGAATSVQASRFLSQAGFAATDTGISELQSIGYEAWLTQAFSTPNSGNGWQWLFSNGYYTDSYHYSNSPMDYMIWCRLISAPDQLRQRVALALSEHFVVSASGISVQWSQFAMAAYWDVLCDNAFGNFRQLLEAVTLTPAMGAYLNMRGNLKEDTATGRLPNENYAREIMQLFTIGLQELNTDGTVKTDGSGQPLKTYTQDTITNLARVFTGWDFDAASYPTSDPTIYKLPMHCTSANHSALAATFLGTTIAAGTDGVTALKTALDTLFNHANVGPFFGRRLIQRLVTSNPSPAYVGRVAAAFNNNGQGVRGDLKAVIRAVLLDPEARSDASAALPTFGKLREPMLRFVQWARTFKATSPPGTWKIYDLSDPSTRLGQSPLRAPSVFNFFRPDYAPPDTALATAGLAAPEFQIANEPSVAGYLNFMQTVIASGVVANSVTELAPDYTTELALASDPTALVNRLNLLLLANQLSTATVTAISTAIASISITSGTSGPLNRVRAAIMLVMAGPEYLIQK
jgi:uncharacterized protein (DUF1800 family)